MESEKPAKDPALTIANAIAEQLPVKELYGDALKAPAQEIGSLSIDLIKCIRLALAPIQIGSALQDRFRSFIDKAIRRIPEERRIPPPPQILGPVLEGIRYEPEGTPIDELFSNLLSSSMDGERAKEAHPSYPYVIKQLSSDEAKLLKFMYENSIYALSYTSSTDNYQREEYDALPSSLDFSENMAFYLARLGGLDFTKWQWRQTETVSLTLKIECKENSLAIREIKLSWLERRFVHACTNPHAAKNP